MPYHLVLEDDAQALLGVVPLYVKGHSRGEYVFDYGWADAYERAGGKYYPKLLSAIPFTPVTGPRLLARSDGDTSVASLERTLALGCMEVARQLELSSLHLNFLLPEQMSALESMGLLVRTDQQFHWHNAGYQTFDDFLEALSSKKRKNLKRERRLAVEHDIDIEWITGRGLSERHWDAFYDFYLDTGGRKWGTPYLNREFFSLIGESMPDDILLIMARRSGRYIAGALNFIGGDTLYGRNWGCIETHQFLHFELCYYQAIEFAIAHGLAHVEAGAQGPHKLARGYLPQHTYSAHWIADRGFRDAVADYLKQERRYVDDEKAMIEQHSPFKTSALGAPDAAAIVAIDRGDGMVEEPESDDF
jgi:predicted N-acyltransferase